MKYLQLDKHLIPTILIKRIEQREEDGVDNGAPIVWLLTVIHFRDGTELLVDEEFEDVCDLLNPIGR